MINLHFVPRSAFVPGWWLTSKAGDEAVAELPAAAPAWLGEPQALAPGASSLTDLVTAERRPPVSGPIFRFSFKLVITSRIDDPRIADVPLYESDVFDVLDQWDGNSARACRDLEDTLQHLVLRPNRRVVVTGGYLQ